MREVRNLPESSLHLHSETRGEHLQPSTLLLRPSKATAATAKHLHPAGVGAFLFRVRSGLGGGVGGRLAVSRTCGFRLMTCRYH